MLNAINLSALATNSLRSIDNWLETIQGNLNGTTRTAFKQSELYYGPSTTYTLREPTNERAGEMLPELSMSTGYTKVDWNQGNIVYSTQQTHFSIQGDGFFAVVDLKENIQNRVNNSGNVVDYVQVVNSEMTFGAGANQGDVYLTRDGEFHWRLVPSVSTTDPILTDQYGNAVLSDFAGALGVGSSDNVYYFVTKSSFDSVNKDRPSVVIPVAESGADTSAPITPLSYDQLEFAKFGATYFNAPTGGMLKTIVCGAGDVLDRRAPNDTFRNSILSQNSLEASNTSFEQNITEMVVLTKVYNSMVQVIKVYNSTLDEILGFIR